MGAGWSQPQELTLGLTAFVAFIAGIILMYVLSFHSSSVRTIAEYSVSRLSKGAKIGGPEYGPAIVLSIIALCFTGGIAYALKTQVYNDNLAASNTGIKTCIGLSWALFIFSVVLIPASLSSARISADSKFYLVATLLAFYFSTLVAIIVFFNKLNNLPNSVDQLDMTTTRNMQMGLLVGTVAYGIWGLTSI